ncbi:hypothetical protein FJZ17_04180, partial [Candidatus Pacearchaeota archaeon]|nr:hypothetical protein [Candidatus Pacearchaeota archaeon]
MKKIIRAKSRSTLGFRRKVIIRLIISLLILAAVLISVSLYYYGSLPFSSTGKAVLTGGYDNVGYATPTGKFSITPDNDPNQVGSNQMFDLRVNVTEPGGYVYAIFYVFNYRLNRWMPFAFPQATEENTNWIANSAEVDLSLNATANLINSNEGKNYIVAYSCKKDSGVWKCGYNDLTGANNQWMLHQFSVSGITNPAPVLTGSCMIDSDCASGNCTNHVCAAGVPNSPSVVEIDSCMELGLPNTLYILQNDAWCNIDDCTGCFVVTADNVILDGNGHQTWGVEIGTPYPSGELIINNFTLRNITAENIYVHRALESLNFYYVNLLSFSISEPISKINGLGLNTYERLVAGTINLINSSVSNLDVSGTFNNYYCPEGYSGCGNNGGNITLINSIAYDLNANGLEGYVYGGKGGNIYLKDSSVNNVYVSGGDGRIIAGGGIAGSGGIIYLESSLASALSSNGGNTNGEVGGSGGQIIIYNSIANSAQVNGGSGGSYGAGSGG